MSLLWELFQSEVVHFNRRSFSMIQKIVSTKWIWLVMVALAVIACDDGGNGGDGNDDTGGGSEFPGDCECAARFTLDGETISICGSIADGCRCRLDNVDMVLSCYFRSSASSDLAQFTNLDATLIGAGSEYTDQDSWLSSLTMDVDGQTRLGTSFEMAFTEYGGIGSVASGTFTATVQDEAGFDNWDITDGQFYAQIVEE